MDDDNFEEIEVSATTTHAPTDGMQPLDTVAENRKNFTTSEFVRAKRTRTLYHNVGAPGIEKFKGMSRTNWIQDCPEIEKDTDTATEIWEPDVANLKGKTTRKKPRNSQMRQCRFHQN